MKETKGKEETGRSPVLRDPDIREPLFDFLEERFGKTRILEEKRMGRSRADIVMVTEKALVGLEIKSDADTYARLAKQAEDYDQYYDLNYVVAGSRHGLHIREHVPGHWGVITVEPDNGRLDFYVLREASANPKLDRKKKLSLLWRPELAHLQERNGLPKYAGRSKEFVIDRILACVPEETLAPQICEELFERDYLQIADTINAWRLAHGKKKRRKTVRKKRRYKAI